MIPENEMGVIVAFTEAASEVGYEIIQIQAGYPDALVIKDEIQYRVEFEFKSSTFAKHAHDPADCDLIVCWENDDGDNPFPTLELSDTQWRLQEWALPTDAERLAAYWRYRALEAEKEMRAASNTSSQSAGASMSKREQIELLARVPDLTQAAVCNILGVSRSYVCEVFKDLRDAGELSLDV